MNVILRPYDKALDYGFIISTWPKAVFYGQDEQTIRSFDEDQRKRWFELKFNDINVDLDRWECRVAVDAEDPTFILGYSVTYLRSDKKTRGILFTYVKAAYRQQGLGKLLCGPETERVYNLTDWTVLGKEIIEKRKENGHEFKGIESDVSHSGEDS